MQSSIPDSPFEATIHGVRAIYTGPGGNTAIELSVAEEVPVAFRYNGFSYAVMMATPADLEDFALGFSLTEGLIDGPASVGEILLSDDANANGLAIDITLAGDSLRRFLARRRLRNLRGHTGCGLCGVEDLEAVRERPLGSVPAAAPPLPSAVALAVQALRRCQPLSVTTRGAHAAAWTSPEGVICCVREDVGRHNSLDKLIGAGLNGSFAARDGFCLITSRCSFEMAQKAIAAGFSALVSISAPTSLAIQTAAAAGLLLYSVSRDGGQFLYTPHQGHVVDVIETEAWPAAQGLSQ